MSSPKPIPVSGVPLNVVPNEYSNLAPIGQVQAGSVYGVPLGSDLEEEGAAVFGDEPDDSEEASMDVDEVDSDEEDSGDAPPTTTSWSAPPKVREETAQEAAELNQVVTRVYDDMQQYLENIPCALQPPSLRTPLMFHQQQALHWLCSQEDKHVMRGGILADDMGVGKTIETLALLCAHQLASTLIICPMTMIQHWKNEIERHVAPRTFRVCMYYGAHRPKTLDELRRYNIVITTYGTLTADFKKLSKAGISEETLSQGNPIPGALINPQISRALLYSIQWGRVILDEAQYIKNRFSTCSKAATLLPGSYRFALTGTPIQNSLDDLFSLLSFIRFPDYVEYADWRKTISGPIREHNPLGYQHLSVLMRRSALRRRKDQQLRGKPILELPPVTNNVINLQFDENDKLFYMATEQKIMDQFDIMAKHGQAYVMRHYTHVLILLLRLRQAACHPYLVAMAHVYDRDTASEMSRSGAWNFDALEQFTNQLIDQIRATRKEITDEHSEELTEEQIMRVVTERVAMGFVVNSAGALCVACKRLAESPVVTPCKHVHCSSCVPNDVHASCSACGQEYGSRIQKPLRPATPAELHSAANPSSDSATALPSSASSPTSVGPLMAKARTAGRLELPNKPKVLDVINLDDEEGVLAPLSWPSKPKLDPYAPPTIDLEAPSPLLSPLHRSISAPNPAHAKLTPTTRLHHLPPASASSPPPVTTSLKSEDSTRASYRGRMTVKSDPSPVKSSKSVTPFRGPRRVPRNAPSTASGNMVMSRAKLGHSTMFRPNVGPVSLPASSTTTPAPFPAPLRSGASSPGIDGISNDGDSDHFYTPENSEPVSPVGSDASVSEPLPTQEPPAPVNNLNVSRNSSGFFQAGVTAIDSSSDEESAHEVFIQRAAPVSVPLPRLPGGRTRGGVYDLEGSESERSEDEEDEGADMDDFIVADDANLEELRRGSSRPGTRSRSAAPSTSRNMKKRPRSEMTVANDEEEMALESAEEAALADPDPEDEIIDDMDLEYKPMPKKPKKSKIPEEQKIKPEQLVKDFGLIAPRHEIDVRLPSNMRLTASQARSRHRLVELKRYSTKLTALLSALELLKNAGTDDKIVIYSQFTRYMDIIEVPLKNWGWKMLRLDGTMKQDDRAQVLRNFDTDPACRILIISLKAGGVGINLTVANHIFLMDPWWNTAVEKQAIDRVHRIGQRKPIFVTRFFVSDTVEQRIMAIQAVKDKIADRALSNRRGDAPPRPGLTFAELRQLFTSSFRSQAEDVDHATTSNLQLFAPTRGVPLQSSLPPLQPTSYPPQQPKDPYRPL